MQISEAQKIRRRQSANRLAGLEIIIAGLILPVVYFISTVIFFNEPKAVSMVIVSVCSVLCIAVGIWIFARNITMLDR